MNDSLLKLCRERIEQKLGWAGSELWINQDFELLSERIFAETKVRLSGSTLKRVWGKVHHEGSPSISTLNALAVFVGYASWSEFKNAHSVQQEKKSSRRPIRWIVGAASAAIVLSTALLALRSGDPDTSKVKFSSRPVSEGLPNSVVFQYDFAGMNVKKAEIQQSWNEKLTFSIDPLGKEATGIYYYPGFFRAKLIADGTIVKEHDLFINSDGWLVTIDRDDKPRYLFENEIIRDGIIRLSDKLFEEVGQTTADRVTQLSFHYYGPMDSITGDSFIYETRFRNTYTKSNGICKFVGLLVSGTEGVYYTHFSIPGCVSDLYLLVAGRSVDGKSADLSAFGTNISEWQTFRLEVEGAKSRFFLNDQLIREEPVEQNIGLIAGMRMRFMGAGELDYVRVKGKGGQLFEEEFDSRIP